MPLRALALLALVAACSADAPTSAHDLEDHLLSPCCFRQTLADHESPMATSLRAEIDSRIARGEPAPTIEADLVARFGPAILAQSDGRDHRWLIGLATSAAVLASLALGLRWLRARRVPPPAAPPAPVDDRYLDRFEDELAATLD